MQNDVAIALAMLRTPGIGATSVRRALETARRVGLPLAALRSLPPRRLLEQLPPGCGALASALLETDETRLDQSLHILDRAARAGVQAFLWTDPDYPAALRRHLGETAPPLLFTLGDLELLDAPMAGIVGARAVSPIGARIAAACAAALTEQGVSIVSGGASGVDHTAHHTSLARGGRTVVVLPQGILTFPGGQQLLDAIDDGRAMLVSEFSPDTPWQTHAAVTRNATISALAAMVCVIEPGKNGGSARTGRCALEQGKRVAVYLAHGTPDDSPGAHLMKNGAVSLLTDHGRFSNRHLLDLWETRPDPRPPQPDLF